MYFIFRVIKRLESRAELVLPTKLVNGARN